jgi:electron transfer flavoprotein beta subunit
MGPNQAKDVLYEALALGADDAYLLSSIKFAGADTWVTAKTLMLAMEKIGTFDIIFAGVEALDGNTAQVPYQISQAKKIPLITRINDIDYDAEFSKSGTKAIWIDRIKGHEKQQVRVRCPLVITTNKHSNAVRYPSLAKVKHVFDKEIPVLTFEDFKVDEEELGLKGSPTAVVKTFNIVHKRKNENIEGSSSDIAKKIVEILINSNVFTKLK